GDIVDLIGDEDPTNEDGDTEVSVSLGEISPEGKKSWESDIGDCDNTRDGGKTASRAIITWGGSYENYKSVGAEVKLLEPGFEFDDQEWVEIGTFSFRRKWGMSRNEGITPMFIPILKLKGQGDGMRCHGSILSELECLGRLYGGLAHEVSSSSSGSHRQAFLRRNAGGDGVGSSLQGDVGLPVPFQVHLGCVGKEANLTEKLGAMEKERDDLMDKNREREEWIKQLEADIAFKISSLTKAERVASTLKEGVNVACFEEDPEAILTTATDYDPKCKTTFMFAFDSLFTKS
nr:hypothetical protein [Tanacetum cinerariifolium]